MKAYWLRIVGAFVLLKFASAVIKDAERVLQEASNAKEGESVGETKN